MEHKRVIKLNKWQREVHQDKSRFLVLNCGRRSGKSTYSAIRIIQYAMDNPRVVVYYVSPSYKQSKAIMWQILRDTIPGQVIRSTNETELNIELINGSRIELKGADAEPDRLRGVRIDFLVCDEVSSFRNWDTVWNKVLRPTLIDSKGSAIFISTPQGFNFWYDLYSIKDDEYRSYTFTTYDNEFIDPIEIDKIKAELDEDTFRQEILAEFTQVSGVVYKEWNFNTNFVDLEYEPSLPLHITIDFGVNDPTAILWIQRNGGEFRIFDYYEASNASIDNICQMINAKPYKHADLITGDPAGKARSITTGTSPIEEMSKHGIYVRTKDGVQIPEQIRITHKHMKSLFVSSKLERLRDCIHNYRYPVKKENTINQSNEIPIHDEYSHSMRALEYYFVNVDSMSTPIFFTELPSYKPADNIIGI
jgi:hypothetical protein